MPATAGRVRMPANNRVHSSAALQTHGIWQSAIGYDPYAPNKEDKKDTSQSLPNDEPDGENAYASFQGLLQLAKITNADVDVSRGACKRCGRVGHLKFQCKNYVKIKDETEEKNLDMSMGLVGLDKTLKGKAARRSNVESSEEEDSESSDSEVDSEIERIIAQRSGKKIIGKGGSSRKKGDLDGDDDSDKKRKKRGRSKKRSGKREVSDSDDSSERRRSRRKRRREHRRKRDKSSDEDDENRRRRRKSRREKRRRRSRPSDSDSDSESSEDLVRHKRKSKRASSSSDSDIRGYNDSRIGRDVNKSEKRRRHREDDE
ncbi:hypothetical protein Lal_00011802 [Lupinus albus]|uniref:Putative transcription factor interactor and regulator CCHC(Zn) family n=1 Tax=Lupinus albus TaxID=3870 RepID=A0A6A5NBA1_LUPAL|nr:putative transcription factor interactor and regulator CCHC(Zn) family [Lupinus albus]KAF1880743.1 hypothetical protein Lal_00011802 [Lupinus albus]